jgi:hypothetical protein
MQPNSPELEAKMGGQDGEAFYCPHGLPLGAVVDWEDGDPDISEH